MDTVSAKQLHSINVHEHFLIKYLKTAVNRKTEFDTVSCDRQFGQNGEFQDFVQDNRTVKRNQIRVYHIQKIILYTLSAILFVV